VQDWEGRMLGRPGRFGRRKPELEQKRESCSEKDQARMPRGEREATLETARGERSICYNEARGILRKETRGGGKEQIDRRQGRRREKSGSVQELLKKRGVLHARGGEAVNR